MPISDLQGDLNRPYAQFLGKLTGKLATSAALLILLLATLVTAACKDSPAFSSEEMESDPLPEFSDSAISGEWLSEGELVIFDVKEHGLYLVHSAKEDDEDEPLVFRLKRVGNLLFMEYSEMKHRERYYRPCWIGLDETALEFHCLEGDELEELGVHMEKRLNEEGVEYEFIRDTQEHLRRFYLEQANNPKVFETTLHLTRPQPARIARIRRQAIAGNVTAQERLARYLNAGEIVERDRGEAKEWACKAATLNRASAQVLCGDMVQEDSRFMDPDHVKDEVQEARAWYQRAADQQFPLAYSKLGQLYEKGVLADDVAAVRSYQRGAELGDPESHAQLGLRYIEGRGVPEDIHLAQQHLELVSEGNRSKEVWTALAQIYLHAIDPDLRDNRRALYAAERALQPAPSDPDLNQLAAEAAFENGQYLAAARYQKDALCEGQPDNEQRIAKLVLYRSMASVSQ